MTNPVAPQPGILFTGTYLVRNGNPGVPGERTVFDNLAFPPASGANAQAQARTDLADLGTVDPPAVITEYMTRNTDPFKNTHDDNGILKGPITG